MKSSSVVRRTFTWRMRSVLWYAQRPELYTHLACTVMARLFRRRPADTREAAEQWCTERAIDTSKAVARITGRLPHTTVEKNFAQVFTKARQTQTVCPATMGGGANLDLLYRLAEHVRAKHVVETGVAYGWSSLALLLSLTKRNGLLISTDMPYVNRNNEDFVGCVVPEELQDRWHIIHRADRDAIPQSLKRLPSFDMCHYDSDKSYEGRMWAYPRLWNGLRAGGYFISDDIADNLAFCDFCRKVKTEPTIVRYNEKYAGVLRKTWK